MKKIAHFGAYDHDSYGDLLFPHVTEFLLPGFSITHVGPTGIPADWPDAKAIIGVEEAIRRMDWDGILVGGGDIIQSGGWSARKWKDNLEIPFSGLPSLWIGASFLAAKLNIPIAWNTPGVPVPLPDILAPLSQLALECGDYLSVRDIESRKILIGNSRKPITVSADSALAVARMWPQSEKTPTIVIGLSKFDMQTRTADVNLAIRRLKRHHKSDGFDTLVLPLMRWEFDGASQADALRNAGVEARFGTQCTSLESIARRIGSSLGYIGNSLHGLITALAYGVPAVLVVPGHNRTSHKYVGFLDAAGFDVSEHLSDTWEDAVEKLIRQKPTDNSYKINEMLNHHVEKIRAALESRGGDKREIWQRITQETGEMSERMSLLGLPPAYFCKMAKARMREQETAIERDGGLASQVTYLERKLADHREALSQATWLVRPLEMALVSWRRLASSRLSWMADCIRIPLRLPVRVLHCLCNPVLRQRTLNYFERRWIQRFGGHRIKELPDLDWLLQKLELDLSAEHVTALLGSYLTRREESGYREMIGQLRAAGEGKPSCVTRPSDLSTTVKMDVGRKRILFICGEFPDPVHGGGGRVSDFIKALSADHDVYVAAWYNRRRDHKVFIELEPYCRKLRGFSYEDLEGGCVAKLLELIDHQPVDIVHYEWPRSLNNFDRRLGRHHIFTHMEVVSCSLWMDLRRMKPLSPEWLTRFAQLCNMLQIEVVDAARVDCQIVVTAKDGDFLSRFVAGHSYYVVNHGITRSEFEMPEHAAEPDTLVFTGNFSHYPNVDAVHFFMREIRPAILAAVPALHVWLVGAHPPAGLQHYHDGTSVFVTGYVPDVRPYIQKASLCIAPLVSGAGLRTKVVQYAALRRPSVVTSIAAEDLVFEDRKEICIADQPDVFAARVIELLRNPTLAAEIAARARNRAMECYDNNQIAKQDLGSLYGLLDQEKEGL